MTPNRFYIEEASRSEGQIVTVKGWVYQKRSSGKIKFLIMRDGCSRASARTRHSMTSRS